MREVIFAFACAESCNQFSDPSAEIGNGSFSGLAQKCFQFAEGLFDWIEIGRIFWQIKQPRTRSVDDLLHSDTFVGREVVYDDDVAALECRLQTLFEIGEEGGSGHRAVHHERRDHFVMAKPGHEGDRLPMPLRHAAYQSLTAPAAPPKPHHICRG